MATRKRKKPKKSDARRCKLCKLMCTMPEDVGRHHAGDCPMHPDNATIPDSRRNLMSWSHWVRDVIPLLGFAPKAGGVSDERHLFGELGVDRAVAVKAYNAGTSPTRFVSCNSNLRIGPVADHEVKRKLATAVVRARLLEYVEALETGVLDRYGPRKLPDLIGSLKVEVDQWWEIAAQKP